MGYVNDDEMAKDLCQETFVAVFQQLPKFRQESQCRNLDLQNRYEYLPEAGSRRKKNA